MSKYYDFRSYMRRKIKELAVGQSFTMDLDGHDETWVTTEVEALRKPWKLDLSVKFGPGTAFTVTLDAKTEGMKYPLAQLKKVGDSILVPVTRREEQSLRVMAARYGQRNSLMIRCSKADDGMRVTVVDPDAEEPARLVLPERTSQPKPLRFGLQDVAVGESVFVPLADEPLINNLRAYCNYHGVRIGAKFRVKAEGGFSATGGHRITRVA